MSIVRTLVAAAAAASLPLVTTGAETVPVSLEDCLKMALEKNLEIRVARYNPMISTLSLSSAYWVYEPTISLGARQSYRQTEGFAGIGQFNADPNQSWTERYDINVIEGRVPTGMTYQIASGLSRNSGVSAGRDQGFTYTPSLSISVTQPILRNLWIDQPRLNIQLAKKTQQQEELLLRNQIIQTSTDVTLAYHDLIAARENVQVQQNAFELAEQSRRENQKRFEVGNMAELDVQEASAQVEQSRAALISAQRDLALAQNALKRLIHDDFGSLQETIYEPTVQLQAIPEAFNRMDSWHKGLTTRPDVLRSRLEMDKQKLNVKFAKNQMFPQLDLVGGYGLTGQDRHLGGSITDIGRQDNPNHFVGIQLSFPLTNRRPRNEYEAAKLRNETTLLQYKQLEQAAMIEIDNSIRDADAALQRVKATEALFKYSKTAWEAEKKRLESGKSTTFLVLQRQQSYISAQAEAIRAKSDYNKALARLARAEGFTLEKYQIRIDFK